MSTYFGGRGQQIKGQRSKNKIYQKLITFELSEDINLNVGNKKINIKDYPRAPDLESKVKNVKVQEISYNSSKFNKFICCAVGNGT